jgi:predicted ribosome quality control (RQC) complex YloA/Tae2 family protein
MIEETNSQILYFEEMKYFVESSNNMQDLQDMYLELIDEKTIKEEKAQNIDFIVFEGVKIYIGKNKKQNDYILSKLSSSEDLWFHPLNIAGAHILVKKNNSKDEISDNVLLKAAQITKEYSSQKNNSKTSIIYTKRKYVKKANNKLAFVTYKNETEIIV